MQYYNDYFDDAGEENEARVIEELGSPEKVAGELKAGLGRDTAAQGEFAETGYSDPRFEDRKVPEKYRYQEEAKQEKEEKGPWTNKTLKLVLLILVILIGAPIVLPIACGILATAFGLIIAAFAVVLSLVAAAGAVAIAGAAVFVRGCFLVVTNLAAALVTMGVGLILVVLGVIAAVALVRLCMIVLPGLCRFVANLAQRLLRRRKAVV